MIILLVPMEIDTGFLAIFISGGGAAMLWALVQAWRTLRTGAQADDLDEYTRMEHSASNEARRRAFAEAERDYWHKRSAAAEYELTRAAGPDTTDHLIATLGSPPEPPVINPTLRRRRRVTANPAELPEPDDRRR